MYPDESPANLKEFVIVRIFLVKRNDILTLRCPCSLEERFSGKPTLELIRS